MSLLTELDAFYTEHRRCGELEAGVDGLVVWICGASMVRFSGQALSTVTRFQPGGGAPMTGRPPSKSLLLRRFVRRHAVAASLLRRTPVK